MIRAARLVLAAATILPIALAADAAPAQTAGAHGEAHYRKAINTLELSLHLDPRTLERAVAAGEDQPFDLDDPTADAAVRDYLRRHFRIVSSIPDAAQQPRFEWVGLEHDDDRASLRFDYSIPNRDERYLATNTLLFDHADGDPANSLTVHIGAELSTLTFTPDRPTQPLPLMTGGEGVTPIQEIVTRGHGPVRLILIPGLGLPAAAWDRFMDRHEDRFTMHALTLPGIGGTEAPPLPPRQEGSPWIDNAVRAVAQLAERNGWHDAALLGHALGGHVAIRLGLEHGELFGPIVSFDGFPAIPLGPNPMTPDERNAYILTHFVPAMLDEQNRLWFFHQRMEIKEMIFDPERSRQISEAFSNHDPRVIAQYLLDLFRADVSEQMSALVNPLLVVAAVSDDLERKGYGTPEMRRQWARPLAATPAASIEYLEQSEHFAFENAPERFDDVVLPFIEEHALETAGDIP